MLEPTGTACPESSVSFLNITVRACRNRSMQSEDDDWRL